MASNNALVAHFSGMHTDATFTRDTCGFIAAVGAFLLLIAFLTRDRLRRRFLVTMTAIGVVCVSVGLCCMATMERAIDTASIGRHVASSGCHPLDETCALRQFANFKRFSAGGV